jgi:hypothetical protein
MKTALYRSTCSNSDVGSLQPHSSTGIERERSPFVFKSMNPKSQKLNSVFSAGLGPGGRAAAWIVALAGAVRVPTVITDLDWDCL